MNRIFALIYIIVAAAITVITTILQVQPALLFIDILAPYEGEKFSLTLVFLLTFLLLLMPFVVFAIVTLLIRRGREANVVVERDATGVYVLRKRQFQSALVGIPVYINESKAGILDNGREKFFPTRAGAISVQAGDGKNASQMVHVHVEAGQQAHLVFEIKQKGLGLEYDLQIVPESKA